MGFHLPACKSSEPHADAEKWREILAAADDVKRAALRAMRSDETKSPHKHFGDTTDATR